MRVTQFSPNHTEVHLKDGCIVLVSYETPVAIKYPIADGYKASAARTTEKYSNTTTRNINKWLADVPEKNIIEGSESYFAELL